jgi:hypothetical protein
MTARQHYYIGPLAQEWGVPELLVRQAVRDVFGSVFACERTVYVSRAGLEALRTRAQALEAVGRLDPDGAVLGIDWALGKDGNAFVLRQSQQMGKAARDRIDSLAYAALAFRARPR